MGGVSSLRLLEAVGPGPRRDFGPGGLALKVTATMIIAEMGAAMSPTSMQSR